MTSHSQGIHQLLQAEKRAKEKLEEAKKRKGRRLKQQTRTKINGLVSNHEQNSEKVLQELLGMVCEIKPEIHINFREAGSH
ncbi:V-type proton ATPase subunit G 3-like isoform X3 [Heterodontus francisci]|uniref:V-type proton ATPase subunit G 3-like isoform X3 n=1 Tax=Heterodontus francisci TaxID=7792 RepID=UPI00355BBC35